MNLIIRYFNLANTFARLLVAELFKMNAYMFIRRFSFAKKQIGVKKKKKNELTK